MVYLKSLAMLTLLCALYYKQIGKQSERQQYGKGIN